MTMFGMTPPMRTGPSTATAASEAGLPYAEIPGDLANRVKDVLANEPNHPDPNVTFDHSSTTTKPFNLVSFLWPHRVKVALAIVLVALETIALQLGPVLTQIGIDDGIFSAPPVPTLS